MTTLRAHGSCSRAAALERLLTFSRIPLGRWPTPLERLDGAARSGLLWVKRAEVTDGLHTDEIGAP